MNIPEEASAHTQHIHDAFERRARELREIYELVSETRRAIEGLSLARRYVPTLEALLENLSDRNVRIVVVGEFSRGKSSLLNALLGHKDFLPTSLSPTTAINTFIRGVNSDHPEPCILVHWADPTRPPDRLPWSGDEVLIRWGTELDKENAQARDQVQKLEAFTDHPLFQHELVIIDTPGLGSLHGHHEQIMQQAIRAADMAIFVMAADQLGGNEHEWRFVRTNLRQNFGRFITIINFWDKVLEETSPQMSALSWEERTEHYLKIVRDSFARALGTNITDEDLQHLTNKENLFPLIPMWSYNALLDHRRYGWSGIQLLTQRLTDLCIHGEAQQEKISTPLQRTQSILQELLAELRQRQSDLQHPQGHEKLSREIEHVDAQIKNIKLELDHHVRNTRADHERNLIILQREAEAELLPCIRDVQKDIEIFLSREYVEAMLQRSPERGKIQAPLPPDLQANLTTAQNQLQQRWRWLIQKIENTLAQLQQSFAEDIKALSEKTQLSLKSTLPSLDLSTISLNLDMNTLIEHEYNQMELRQQTAALRDRLEELEENLSEELAQHEQVKLRQTHLHRSLEQANKAIDDLGPCPPPTISRRKRELGVFAKIGRFFTGEKPEDWIETQDLTQVEIYRTQEHHTKERAQRLREELEEVRQELHAAKPSTLAQKKEIARRQRELEARKQELQTLEAQAAEERKHCIHQAWATMRAALTGQLRGQEESIRRFMDEVLKHAFEAQVETLERHVREEFEGKLQLEITRREELITILKQGEDETQAQIKLLRGYESTLEPLLDRVQINLKFL